MLLAAYVFLLAFLPTALNTVAAFSLLALWAGDRLSSGDFRVGFARSYVPALLFLGALKAATIGSATVRGSLPSLVLWFSYLAVFFVATQWLRSDADTWLITAAWVTSAVLVSLVAFMQYLSGIETQAAWVDVRMADLIRTRVYSVFDNPNMLAEYLSYATTLALAAFLGATTLLGRLTYGAAGLFAGIALILTFSRGGWVAAAIGALVVGALKDRRVLAVMFIVALLSPAFLPESVLLRVESAITLEDTSATYRLTIWKAVWRIIRDKWATGIGPGPAAFAVVYPQYEIAGTPAAHTHNLYLQILVEAGIVGLALFIWTVINHYRDALAAAFRRLDIRTGLVLAALVGGTSGQMLHGFIDNIWYSPKNVMFFWIAIGLAVGISRAAEAKSCPPGTPGAAPEVAAKMVPAGQVTTGEVAAEDVTALEAAVTGKGSADEV
jgi:O-antigen ligase